MAPVTPSPSRPRTTTYTPAAPGTLSTLSSSVGGGTNLRSGASGASVTELQTRLRDLGYPVTVDGKFGPETERAVRQFQLAMRDRQTAAGGVGDFKVDGIVGPQTLAALQRGGPQINYPTNPNQIGAGTNHQAPTNPGQRQPGTVRPGELEQSSRPRRGEITGTSGTEGGSRTINGVPVRLADQSQSPEQQYQHYERIVRASGGEIKPGERHVLALRGMDPAGATHDTRAQRGMNDTMVVMWRDQQGQAHVQHYRGSTYPGQANSTMSPDVTGDGRGDVGMVREGNYRMHAHGEHNGAPSWHMRTLGGSGSIPGVRDTNHDGRHSTDEWAASGRRGDTLSGVLMHRGTASGGVASVGCQNVQDYDAFLATMGRGSYNYTLINANGAEPR